MHIQIEKKPKSLVELNIEVEPQEYDQYLKTAAQKISLAKVFLYKKKQGFILDQGLRALLVFRKRRFMRYSKKTRLFF